MLPAVLPEPVARRGSCCPARAALGLATPGVAWGIEARRGGRAGARGTLSPARRPGRRTAGGRPHRDLSHLSTSAVAVVSGASATPAPGRCGTAPRPAAPAWGLARTTARRATEPRPVRPLT